MKVFKLREVITTAIDVYVDAESKDHAMRLYHEGEPAAFGRAGIDYRKPAGSETVVAYCEETENPA